MPLRFHFHRGDAFSIYINISLRRAKCHDKADSFHRVMPPPLFYIRRRDTVRRAPSCFIAAICISRAAYREFCHHEGFLPHDTPPPGDYQLAGLDALIYRHAEPAKDADAARAVAHGPMPQYRCRGSAFSPMFRLIPADCRGLSALQGWPAAA